MTITDHISGAIAGRTPVIIEMTQVCQTRRSGAAQLRYRYAAFGGENVYICFTIF